MLNKEVKVILDLVRMKADEAHPKRLLKFFLPIFIGFLVFVIGQASVAPQANGAIFGTIYNAPVMSFGGGNYQGVDECAADQVIVGVTFNQNPMSWGYKCSGLNSDFTLPALTTALRATANYVFCPDGKAAVGFKMINSGGNRLALSCKTMPLVNDTEALTDFVANQATTKYITRTTQAFNFTSMCTAGDILVGAYIYSNLWFDQLGGRCAPFNKFTVTYNANSGTGTVPTVQTQSIPAQTLTTATWSGTRTGFHLDGWNTLANGLGTDYAQGASILPGGPVTLYAKWTSTITYNGNTNTGGTVPDPTVAVSSAAVTNLAPNSGSLVKTGFTFGGWNTLANGSGTTYLASNPALVTETPYMLFDANDFNDATNAWTDGSGNSRSIPGTAVTNATTGSIRGNPTKVTNAAGSNGASKSFAAVQGTTADGIVIGNGALTNYTFCHVARYAGATKDRIFAGTTGNWLSGFWTNATGVAYHEGWITASTGTNDTNWKIQCDTGGSKSLLRSNGVLKSSVANNSTGLPASISINLQGSRSAPSGLSDWAVAEFVIYDSVLSDAKIQEIEERLNRKYGVGLYTSTIHTLNYASTGDTTLYAQWNSTITYNGNGQTSASSTVPAATTAKGTAANTTLATAGTMVKTGYSFAGWNTAADGTGTDYASGLTTYQSAGSTTLYAKWRRTITYNSNGANSGSPERATDVFVNSTTPTVSTFPTVGTMLKNGYTFAGWSATSTGTLLTAPYATSAEVTLYAKWTANTYAVVYDTSTVTSGTMANTSLTAGTAFSLRANAFARTGYSFKNWNTASNGSGTTYTNNQSITLYADLTLYPQWNLLAPGAPTVSTAAGNTEVTVTPTAATASNTVGAPTSMLVSAFSSAGAALNKTCTVVSPATNCLITGLTNGTTYQFSAVSINATGTSSSSTKVNGIPAGVVVTYDATSNGGALTTFTITNRVLTSQVATLTTSTPHEFTVGMSVVITMASDTRYAGTRVITAIPTPTSFSYALGLVNLASTSVSDGTVTWLNTPTFNKGTPLINPSATKTGYTFAGWYTTQSSGGQLVGAAGATYTPTSAITLYARYSGIIYTISYNGNGNTGGTVPANGSYQAGSSSGYNNTQSYDYTGSDQTFNVPNDISGTQEIQVEVWGAGGGGTALYYSLDWGGGAGGYTKATISTPTAGETLTIKVGKGGTVQTTTSAYGGGGVGGNTSGALGASGGGYSGVFTGTTPLAISGGGGGASPGHAAGGIAGGGGGANQSGAASSDSTMAGRGGTTSAGGAKAASCATDGSQYTGGTGCGGGGEAGGGGGAGYYGGGGGNSNGQANGGGGGGSGYLDATRGSLVTATVGQNGALASTWAYPNKTSANYGSTNAGRGGKGYTNTTADSAGGNGRIVIQWKTGTGAYTILGSPSKVGYTFAGWNTAADGTGTNYAVNDAYSTNANLTLFAKWTPANRTVTYVLDGGSSSADTSQLTGKVVGNTITLPAANTMSKTGYVFGGWSDGATTYAGGATWTVPASDNNFTLTAQWTTQTLSYSYDTNGGGTAPTGGTKTYGQTLVLEASTGLSKVGYTFAGWNDGSTTHLAGASITLNASKVFVAQWSAQSFTISYSGNTQTSGSVTSGSYVAGGVPYAIAANGFTKTGYTFAGWKDSSNNSYAVGSGYSTAANLVLTAQWTASSFTISYNANGATGGTVPVDGAFTTAVAFSTAVNSGTLVKSGYTFAGWNTSASGTGTTYTEGAALTTTSNVTLYAKWSIISPLITFNQGAATTTPSVFPANTSAQYGSLFTLPVTDTSTVISTVTQIFTGWSDGTNTYAVGDTYRMGTANVTFTAQWVAVYTVRYVLNGGSGSVPADVLRTNAFTETLTTATVTKTGYTLSGWKDQSGVSIPSGANSWTISGSSYVAYAQWSPTSRTLSFDINGGSVSESSITGKVIGELVTLPTPTGLKTGYTFGGWSKAGTTYPAGGSFLVGDGDAAFTAVWVGNINTITYNGNGATGGTVPANGSYVSGDSTAYTVAGNTGTVVKTGFTFDGWYTTATGSGGTAYTAGTGTLTTTSNLTLYAKWSASSYAVTFDTDGGGNAPTQSNTMYGANFTLPSAPTKSGSNFLGWETSSNLYAPGSTFTMGSSALSFIARWSTTNYAITYLLNGGSGVAPTQANVDHNQSFTTATAPTKSGFTFTGWSDGATTTNAATAISNVTSNLTLTAQWTIAVPGVPGTPTVAPGNGSATITISAPSTGGTPSSYTVTASPGGATCTVTAPGTSCTIAPLTNGTSYTFTSTATNSAGSSASASTTSTSVTPAGVPDSPTGVNATGTGGTANVSWTTPTSDGGSAVTDYVIEYSVAGSGTWTTFTDGVSTATSATVTGLTAGNAYEFRVTAKNIIGSSLASFASPTIETLPTAPAITGTTAASGQVTVTWSAPAHLGSGTITDYTITAYDSSGNVAGSCNPNPGQTTCVVTGLDNGTPYTFKAVASTTVGDSVDSSATSPATPSGVPSSPSDVAAVVSGSNMTVTFTAPVDNGGAAITSYVVTSDPAGATCTVGANATTYVCTGLTAGTNYTYTVKAVNTRGESSASLASTAVTAVAAPSAPQNVSAVITAGSTTLSATVSFDAPLNENGSAVISYTVTASPGGATCTVTAPTLYCDIPVLPDSLYTFTATATNGVGTSVASTTSLQTAAANGIAPSLVVDPAPAPSGTVDEGSTLTSLATYTATPNAVITYVWKRCTDQFNDTTCSTISGATSATYVTTSSDADKFIRVLTTGTNSIGYETKLSEATAAIIAAPVVTPTPTPAPSSPSVAPEPAAPSCDSACQAVKDAAATKAAADAAAKAAADKLAADAAAKLKADAAATTASTKAAADAAAAAAAAKAAVEKAAAAELAKIAADTAAKNAAAQAKAAADAQAAANKAAATAAAALKNSAATAATKAAATASANKAAATAAAAVKAAATAATAAAKAQSTAANANKQVDIAINSLSSKTAASQASAQANAIAAAAKAAANEAAGAAANKAAEAKAIATSAQKAAADTAARIASEQKEAATAAAAAKSAADAAAKATAEKIAATTAAKNASESLVKVLDEKATLAEEAAKATDETVRAEIQKKIEEVSTKAEEIQKVATEATTKADEAINAQEAAVKGAESAKVVAETEAAQAVAVKAESIAKTAAATKAVAAATVAAKVATAAKAAAAKVPSKAVIATKPSTSTSKNSAKATVTGLKPGQKVKVTVNVKDK